MHVRSLLIGVSLSALLSAQRIEAPVAEINGKPYTGAAIERLVDSLDFGEREMARINLPEALKYQAFRERLAADAEKAKLGDESPYKEELAIRKVAILMPAEMDAIKAAETVTPEQARQYYDENKDELEELRFKLLFVAFAPPGKPGPRTVDEAKARVAEIQKKLAAGASFTDMVKEYSDAAKSRERGGDYATPITRTTTIPGADDIVPILFGLLPGKVSDPIQVGNGIDLFQVIDRKPPTFEAAQDEVKDRLKTIARAAKLVEIEKTVELKVQVPSFFAPAKTDSKVTDDAGDTVVALLDGRPITGKEVGRIAEIFPPGDKEKVLENKEEMLRKYGLMTILAARAEKAGLAQREPYKGRLAMARIQTLAQAQMNAAGSMRAVSPDEQRSYYDTHKDDYVQVKATGIYIPFGEGKRTENEARARAEEFLSKVKKGGELVPLIKEYSEDADTRDKNGELGTIGKTAKLADEFKSAVFALKPGEWTAPLQQPNGFYVIRADRTGALPYDEVKEDIYRTVQQNAFNEYVAKAQAAAQFKILDTQYFAQKPGGKFLK